MWLGLSFSEQGEEAKNSLNALVKGLKELPSCLLLAYFFTFCFATLVRNLCIFFTILKTQLHSQTNLSVSVCRAFISYFIFHITSLLARLILGSLVLCLHFFTEKYINSVGFNGLHSFSLMQSIRQTKSQMKSLPMRSRMKRVCGGTGTLLRNRFQVEEGGIASGQMLLRAKAKTL